MTASADSVPWEARLQLLGRWNLSVVDGDPAVPAETTQKLMALLALRGTLSRSQIWGTLWPDATTVHASGRLRTAMWRLAGGRLLLLNEDHGQLNLPHGVRVDVWDLYSAAAALARGDNSAAARPEMALFSADLLPDWDDDWLVVDREQIRQLRLHSLESLSTLLLQERRFGAAVEAALAAVSVDPLRESAHRAVICAHLAEGNAAEALRQFDICRRLYAEQLNAVPSRALFSLVSDFAGLRPHRW
ncbi:bacterial transcriptional activator domain-containing protein [Paenarthrobacter sp. PH39-S1]|uniref:AfsR/SARP family transcriptional regulator n=1 Tax=Paenarthrobacter sp. PH39-S1 TaxID=3046204 RepID=UPI0024B8DBEF|nr:bacterial transcriptional activator domain-containing protein [Paenarthrobacter sp. PH39-S1]MDJ0355309.1 bacterial transcriptional activator domain-containing protein [Paenarthrobacter sp. PH39-S1]